MRFVLLKLCFFVLWLYLKYVLSQDPNNGDHEGEADAGEGGGQEAEAEGEPEQDGENGEPGGDTEKATEDKDAEDGEHVEEMPPAPEEEAAAEEDVETVQLPVSEVRSSQEAAKASVSRDAKRSSQHLGADWSRDRPLTPEEAHSVEEFVEQVVSQASDIMHEQHLAKTEFWPRDVAHETPVHHSNLEMISSLGSEQDATGTEPPPGIPEENMSRFEAEVSGIVQDGGSLARMATGRTGDDVVQYTVPGVESAGIYGSIPWMSPSDSDRPSAAEDTANRTRTANYVRRRTDGRLEWELGSSDPESYPTMPPPPGPPTPPRQFSAAIIQYTVPGVPSRNIRGSLPWMTPLPSPLGSGEIDPRQSRRALLGEIHQWDPNVHQHTVHGVESRGARRSMPWVSPLPSPLPSNVFDPRLHTPRDSQRSFPGLWPPERPPQSESEESVGPPRQFSADVHQHTVPGVDSRGIRGSLPWMTPFPSPMPSGMVDPRVPDRARVSSDYIDFTQEQPQGPQQPTSDPSRFPGYFEADVHQHTVPGVDSRGVRGSLPWMTPLPSPLPSLMNQLDPRHRHLYSAGMSHPNVHRHTVPGVESRGIRGSLPWMTPLPSPLPSDMIDPRLVEPPPRQFSADVHQHTVPGVESRGVRGSLPWMTPFDSPISSELRAQLDAADLTHPEQIDPAVLRQMDPRILLRMDPRVLQAVDPHLSRQVEFLRMRRPSSGEDIVLDTQDISDVSGLMTPGEGRTSGYMTDHSSLGHGSLMHGGGRSPYSILPPIARGDSVGTEFIPSVETIYGSLSMRTVYDASLSSVRRISTADMHTPDTSHTDGSFHDERGRPRRLSAAQIARRQQSGDSSRQDLRGAHPHHVPSGYLGDHDLSSIEAARMRAMGASVTGVPSGVPSEQYMLPRPSVDSNAPQTVTINQCWYGFDWAGDWERREYEMVYHGLHEYYQISGYMMDTSIDELTREMLMRSLDQDPYDEDQVKTSTSLRPLHCQTLTLPMLFRRRCARSSQSQPASSFWGNLELERLLLPRSWRWSGSVSSSTVRHSSSCKPGLM